jgi:hypothetical protein
LGGVLLLPVATVAACSAAVAVALNCKGQSRRAMVGPQQSRVNFDPLSFAESCQGGSAQKSCFSG